MKWLLTLTAALLALIAPRAAHSACTTVSATTLSFGTYTGLALTNSTANVTVNCSTGFAFSVGLNGGAGTVAARIMTSGSAALAYSLFQNASHTSNWGNTAGTDAEPGTGTGSAQPLTVYATLASLQYPAPGTYTDTILVSALNSGISASFLVSATVVPTCTIAATTLAFGVYYGAPTNEPGSITVTCTATTSYTVGLNAGVGSGATVSTRHMTGAVNSAGNVDTLNYGLFRDAADSVNWGNTPGTDTVAGTGTGGAQTLTVYGQLFGGQFNSPVTYQDIITATVTY